MSFINNFNIAMFILFTLMYMYQGVYTVIAVWSKFRKNHVKSPDKLHKYAVVIAARNEENVIGELVKSIKNQKYPRKLVDIFVVADNCTDYTALKAKAAGAIVYERNDKDLVGKGHALNYMFHIINEQYADKKYEGYFVFDADNLLDENYIAEMNKYFDSGYRVLTSYRNSKNYDHNWISAGYALWFLHEAQYLNNPRMLLKTSCAISGTGFLIHKDIVEENGGWIHYLLTEDIEFSISQVIKGEVIGYCGSAVLYDEQPCTFKQSWYQRLRWAKGFYQVLGKYGKNLSKSIFKSKKNPFSCYDMLMNIMPALLISITSIIVNTVFFVIALNNINLDPEILVSTISAITTSVSLYYVILFAVGLVTTITEWKNIYCKTSKKIFFIFTFPIFIFTYLPISIVALFKKVEWRPIAHTCVKTVNDVRRRSNEEPVLKQSEVTLQQQFTNIK